MWLEEAAEWATWERGCHNPESTSAGTLPAPTETGHPAAADVWPRPEAGP